VTHLGVTLGHRSFSKMFTLFCYYCECDMYITLFADNNRLCSIPIEGRSQAFETPTMFDIRELVQALMREASCV